MTKLAQQMDRWMEGLWLAALVFSPIYFNVYSSRVFEPDKVALVRALATLLAAFWAIKLIEGWRTRSAERIKSAPWWQTPMVLTLLLYAGWYVISSLLSVAPYVSIFGSYQRLGGLISQLSYMTLGLAVLFNLRSRAQVERLINFALATTVPVVLYAMLQHEGMDPFPWAGDVTTRVASSFGNPTFLGTWLVMMLPLILYRITTLASYLQQHRASEPNTNEGWRAIGYVGVVVAQNFVLWVALICIAGVRDPNFMLWAVYPLGILIFFALTFVYANARMSREVAWAGIAGTVGLFILTLTAIMYTGSLGPLLGMFVAVIVFSLLALWVRRTPRWTLATAMSGSVAVVLFLVVLNLPHTPLSGLTEVKYIGRLGQFTNFNEGSGKVLATVWQGSANLLISDTTRLAIGYGPESLYYVYGEYYPAELQHWELRNATPDGNQDWIMDQLVWGGIIMLGLFVLLLFNFYTYSWREMWRAGPAERQLLFVALIAMISGYLVAEIVSHQLAATLTYFYAFIGLAVAVGHFGALEAGQDNKALASVDITELELAKPALGPLLIGGGFFVRLDWLRLPLRHVVGGRLVPQYQRG